VDLAQLAARFLAVSRGQLEIGLEGGCGGENWEEEWPTLGAVAEDWDSTMLGQLGQLGQWTKPAVDLNEFANEEDHSRLWHLSSYMLGQQQT
jgi:hypothetical protein